MKTLRYAFLLPLVLAACAKGTQPDLQKLAEAVVAHPLAPKSDANPHLIKGEYKKGEVGSLCAAAILLLGLATARRLARAG